MNHQQELDLIPGVKFVGEKKNVTVKHVETWTENHLSSSGGGGYIDPKFGGYVNTPNITNNIVERKSIYVAGADGVESEYRLSIPARQGQELEIYSVSGEGESDAVLVHNKSMHAWHAFSPNYKSKAVGQLWMLFTNRSCASWKLFRRLFFLSILVGIISIALVAWLADYYYKPEDGGPGVLWSIMLVVHILCYPTLLISLIGLKTSLRKCMTRFETALESALKTLQSA